MTKLQAIRKFAEQVTGGKVIIKKSPVTCFWGMSVTAKDPRLFIPSDLGIKKDEEDKEFRANITSICPIAKGFGDATLAILHECGHWFNRSAFDSDGYQNMIKDLSNKEYMRCPYEMVATLWAVCWLQNKDHRKWAKEFERNYFGY